MPKELPEEIKEAKGTLRADRKGSSTKFTKVDGVPTAPDHWPDDMQSMYYHYASELHNKGLLFSTDMELLKTYVHACYLVADLRDKMFEYPDYFSKEFASLHLRWERTVAMMDRIGGKFGFNPVDKSKVWSLQEWKKKKADGVSLEGFLEDIKEIKG